MHSEALHLGNSIQKQNSKEESYKQLLFVIILFFEKSCDLDDTQIGMNALDKKSWSHIVTLQTHNRERSSV